MLYLWNKLLIIKKKKNLWRATLRKLKVLYIYWYNHIAPLSQLFQIRLLYHHSSSIKYELRKELEYLDACSSMVVHSQCFRRPFTFVIATPHTYKMTNVKHHNVYSSRKKKCGPRKE